jgi:uncharacterized OB-fold protein
METYTKPVPRVTEETKPYWEGCRRHQLLIQRCKGCGKFQFYPRALCSHCLSDSLEWVEARGTGTIYSFSNVYRPPSKEFKELPYIVAIIELDEGVRMMSNVVNVQPGEVWVGMRVKVVFEDIHEDLSLPKFARWE